MSTLDAARTAPSVRLHPIDPATAADLRRRASVVRVADVSPGYPCRVCLRDADVGDVLVLASYDPFAGWEEAAGSPYRSAGPVYVHREDCSARVDASPVPLQLRRRVLSVRVYDARAMMIDARVVDGEALAPVLDEISALESTHRVHLHNAGPGCFAAAVEVIGAHGVLRAD